MSIESTQKNVHLHIAPTLVAEMEAVAQAEGKTLDEIAQKAMQQFLEARCWQNLITYGKKQARTLGLKNADVPRLIAESRRDSVCRRYTE